MQYVQVGEIGKAVLITSQSELPVPSALYENKYYYVNIRYSNPYTVRCIKDDNGVYSWQKVSELPALSNGISSGEQLKMGIQAIDANGNKVTGTMKFAEKTITANGVYVSSEDGVRGYSKVTVDIPGEPGETAQNPYIATTETEMKAYLAEEHVGSFVKYKTPSYFDQANSTPLNCRSKTEFTGAIDTGLGPAYVIAKIDEWLPEPGLVKIASIETFNHDTTFMGVSISYSLRGYNDFYAWKYKDSNGVCTRAIIWADVTLLGSGYDPPTTTTWDDYSVGYGPLFIDRSLNDINEETTTALQNLPITMTVDSKSYTLEFAIYGTSGSLSGVTVEQLYPMGFLCYHKSNPEYNDYWGKWLSGGDSNKDNFGIMGTAYLAWATYRQVYWNSVTYPRCTYLYKDASVLFAGIQTSSSSQNYTMESQQTYRDGFVYIVNSKKATRNKWQAESPLVEGDQLAGATYYFNQQITHKEYADLCKQLIPSSERVDDDSDAYFFYNVDNPQPKGSMDISNIVAGLPLMDVDERYNMLMSYLFYPSNVPHTPVNPIAVGDTITSLEFATEITPDFTKFDWSQAEVIDGIGKVLTIIEGTTPQYSDNVRLQVGMIPAGTDLDGHMLTNDNYIITAGTGGETVYATEEYAQMFGYTLGWAKSFLSIESTTVTSVSQQDIWGKYISKDGRWSPEGSGDWFSVFLFGSTGDPAEITDTTTITSASVVVPTSYTYADMIQTVPATLGKVNKPLITNGIIGKTPNFTKTTEEYSIYYFTQEVVPGNMFTESSEVKMDALLGDKTTNNEIAENRVYLYTGQDGKYVQGALYILTED